MTGFRLRMWLGALVLWAVGTSLAPAQTLFPDRNLEAVVRKYVLDKRDSNEPLTASDVATISTIVGKGVRDLSGLELCRRLTRLSLEGNEIEDLSPLRELRNLQYLNLAGNVISDLRPLAGLSNLQYLDLSKNRVADLSPMAGLTSLRSIYLSNNQIQELAPLAGLNGRPFTLR